MFIQLPACQNVTREGVLRNLKTVYLDQDSQKDKTMLAPRNALVSNLNYVHLQHVSLGVHLSLHPELMENSITKDPGKGVTGHHHLWKDIADSVEVDANSNDPSIPCQCCDKHLEHMSPCVESSEDNLEANTCEELLSPYDLPSSPLSVSSPSSNSSSSSDFTLDESPASMYYKEFLENGLETPDQQPDIIPLDAAMENSLSLETKNPTILPPPSTPEESKTYSTATATVTSIEKGHATSLDANCNDVSGLQPIPSPPTSGSLSCDEDSMQRTETLNNNSKSTENQEVTQSTWPFLEDDELLPGLVLHGHVNTQSPRKTITSFNELAQKRRRGSGVGPSQQAKKDKSDWLIVFSPDSENPPVNELTATAFYQGAQEQYNLSSAAGKEVTTFREMKYRSTLSKQSAQQAKFQTNGNMGPQKPASVEKEFQHLSDREMWLEIPCYVENGSPHPNENGSHRQKEKEQKGEDMAGLPYHYGQEIRQLKSGSRREHMEAADGRVQDLWSASGYTVPMSNTRILSPRSAYVQSTFNGSHPLAKNGEKWVRGKADGGDKKYREGYVFGPQAIPPHLLIQLPTNHRLIFPPASLSPPSLAMRSATALLPCSPCAVLQTLPARMSPVGALSPPHRGFLHLLDTRDVSILQSPLFPRIRTLTRVSPEREPACTPHLDTPSTVQVHFMADGGKASQHLEKKGLLVTIGFSVDNIICHFNNSRNQVKKAQLGDSKLSPELGRLLLTGLCPSLYKLLADELKPFQKDVIIGSRRLSPWNLVETSIKPDSTPGSTLCLFRTISRFSQLRDPQRRFNAFIFGLLNTKQLDVWISHLHQTHSHYSAFYGSYAFLMLAATSQPELFDELLLILQPLSALNFHVDLLFEHYHLQDLPDSHQLHSYGQIVSDPWGGRSLKHILHWGEQLAHNLVGNKEDALPTRKDSTQVSGVPIKDTPDENCSPTPDSPQESTRNWWQHLSQASRVYMPSRRDSFSLTHLMNGISWGTTEPGKVEEASLPANPESTQSRAQEEPLQIKEEGNLTAQPNEIPKPLKDQDDTSRCPTGLDGETNSADNRDKYIKPDTRNEAQSNEEWGIWLGNLFGANSTQDREMEKKRVKSRRPSSWLPPNISIFGLAKKPPPPESVPSPAADRGDTTQQNKGKKERSVRALCDHTSTDQDQLTFKKDDVLQLLSTVDEDWICCRHGMDTGLVPVGYTSLIL